MPQSRNPEIVAFIELLADTGSHYRMDEMTVMPWPDLANAKGCLPPRSAAPA